jgi:hypothetical protein
LVLAEHRDGEFVELPTDLRLRERVLGRSTGMFDEGPPLRLVPEPDRHVGDVSGIVPV